MAFWRFIRTCIALGITVWLITLLTVLGTAIFSTPCSQVRSTYDQIIVLGAGMDPDGTLHDPAQKRVAPAVTLLGNGIASTVHFTGGRAIKGGPAAGEQMAKLAIRLGAKPDRLTHEDESLSTLQNALFSADMLDTNAKTLVISEGFHLLRSHASFRWAGFKHIDTCHSTRLRGSFSNSKGILIREIIAYPVNAIRAGLFTTLSFGGISPQSLHPLLR